MYVVRYPPLSSIFILIMSCHSFYQFDAFQLSELFLLLFLFVLLIVDIAVHVATRWRLNTFSATQGESKNVPNLPIPVSDARISQQRQPDVSVSDSKHDDNTVVRTSRNPPPVHQDNTHLPSSLDLQKKLSQSTFSHFTERLLFTNKLWAQNTIILQLRDALLSVEDGIRDNAFNAFLDRLVLSNTIWRQRKELDCLKQERDKIKGSRVKSVVSLAKSLASHHRKEALTKRLVVDLVDEVNASKRETEILREEHEREVQKINELWVKDYRGIVDEVEKSRLAESARVIQQEISNDLERELRDELDNSRKEVEALRGQVAEYERLIEGLWSDLHRQEKPPA
ncbi:uncharacterized protein EV420DRAFT_1518477 [Desarmillaria tabescens]|uniref:Uncharacterized protein n=1 Tax=Armillaria tabescens TaxID=1929756 RepID=A0AA39NDJ1_ARMTA|nr:uncharacterized protein EV420DRAFT_1518477 [Desarmillaria tabescens]KAK0463493.1 hypothetical protein EV420DRAFT_1518477 [Desarmillaria tabescens]